MYSGKSGCFWDKWLFSGKVFALEQGGCIRAKVVVFGHCGCIQVRWLPWSKVVVFGKKWLYSGGMFLFGQSDCIRAKVV